MTIRSTHKPKDRRTVNNRERKRGGARERMREWGAARWVKRERECLMDERGRKRERELDG